MTSQDLGAPHSVTSKEACKGSTVFKTGFTDSLSPEKIRVIFLPEQTRAFVFFAFVHRTQCLWDSLVLPPAPEHSGPSAAKGEVEEPVRVGPKLYP